MKPLEIREEQYRRRISEASKERHTRIILALDVQSSTSKAHLRSVRILKQTLEHLCGLKLGRQTVLNLGIPRTQQLIKIVKDENIPCLVDDKLNDIGETNASIADAYFRIGFDALTANPFTGWKDGLQPVFQLAQKYSRGIILLTYMSHLGASEGYGQKVVTNRKRKTDLQYRLFARKALEWKADGAVVGATRPEIIRDVKSILQNKVPIYSPGVGVQGGGLGSALKAGSDYLIVGRSIANASDPALTAARLADESMIDYHS